MIHNGNDAGYCSKSWTLKKNDGERKDAKGKIIETIDPSSGQEQQVRAKGALDIHGVSQERIIKGSIRISGDKIFLLAEFSVPLEDHDIKIPKVVYQKIAETVDVTVRAELIRKKD